LRNEARERRAIGETFDIGNDRGRVLSEYDQLGQCCRTKAAKGQGGIQMLLAVPWLQGDRGEKNNTKKNKSNNIVSIETVQNLLKLK